MEILTYILIILIAYLFGSVPWGLFIGKVFFHKDIRKEGSGNSGGTNAGRVLGKPIGVLVILLDGIKGLLAMTVAHFLAPGFEIYAGLACCFGHCFPVFAGFRGGKAVSTAYGFLLGIAVFITGLYFWNFLWAFICFLIILYFSRMVSLSSMASLWIEAFTCVVLYFMQIITQVSIPISIFILCCFVTYRHKSNLERIVSHTESKIKWMGKAPWEK